jgi:hypothetical protein
MAFGWLCLGMRECIELRCFLLQAVCSVTALLALALSGLGPRTHAAMMYLEDLGPASMDSNQIQLSVPDCSPAIVEAEPTLPADPLPVAELLTLSGWFFPTDGCSNSGTSSNSSPPVSGLRGLLLDPERDPPPLVTVLRAAQAETLPAPALSSVFHPPRLALGS